MFRPHLLLSKLNGAAACLLRGVERLMQRLPLRSPGWSRNQIAIAAAVAALPLSAALATIAVTADDLHPAEETAASSPASSGLRHTTLTVNPAETTASLLARLGISDPELQRFIYSNADASVFAYPAQGLLAEADVNPDGTVSSLSLYLERGRLGQRRVTIGRSSGDFTVSSAPFEWKVRTFAATVTVDSGAQEASERAGIPEDVAQAAASVPYKTGKLLSLARKGDSISYAYETRSIGGQTVGSGRLLAVSLTHGGLTIPLFWFDDGTPQGGFYFADGKTARLSFRRFPLNAFRMTSGFSAGRRHPVLGRVRPHLGVDLAAPRGAPVYAVADGIVKAADRSLSGYGNRIDIRHGGGIMTRYGHLSGYARGIQPGKVVTRGQLIGYCGSSGLATGPHVHFEFHVNDKPVDPSAVALPGGTDLPSRYLSAARPRIASIAQAFDRQEKAVASAAGRTVPAAEISGEASAVASAGAKTPERQG